MEAFLLALRQTMVLLFMGAVGYVLRKRSVIKPSDNGCFSWMVLKVGIPSMIIASFSRMEMEASFAKNVVILILCLLVVVAICLAVGFVFGKAFRCPRRLMGVWQFGLIFTNGGFIGLVILSALYSTVTVVYGTFAVVFYNVVMITLGVWLMNHYGTKNTGEDRQLKKILTDPLLCAGVVGLIISVFSIPLPGFVYESLDILKGLNSPVALFLMGSALADAQLKSAVRNPYLYVHVLLKTLVLPFLVFFLFSRLGIDTDAVITLVIFTAMPSPSVMAIYAEKGGSDVHFASQLTVLSTVVSIATIPLFAYLLSMI